MIRAVHENIVVKTPPMAEKTASGLFLPTTRKEYPEEGIVISVGEGRYLSNGTHIPNKVSVGQKIRFGKWAGMKFEHDGDEIVIIKQRDILAILED